MAETDLVVAGGGPAGLATAIRARMSGLEVVVLDAADPPIDKACGEGLMPDGVEILDNLGVSVDRVGGREFHGIRYVDGGVVAEGTFPGRPGIGIRRTVLHNALRLRAADLGVDLRWGSRVQGLTRSGFLTAQGPVVGRWLVAADGRSSKVRKWAGLDGRPVRRRRIGLRRHYEIEPWSDLVEVYWSDGFEAYVTPVSDRMVGVAMLTAKRRVRFDSMLAGIPVLEQRLAGAPVISRDRGAGPLEQRSRRPAAGCLALVGDAAGSLDAITGEGLTISFRGAEAVVGAILGGSLDGYAEAHRRIVRFPKTVTRLLLEVERRPQLRRRVIRSLANDPTLMSRFLALKLNQESAGFLGSEGLLPLTVATLRG